jgi:hypothetical protein
VFLIVLGLIVGGLVVFRYQEMSWLAREGARYAIVRGSEYEMEMKARGYTTTKAVTADDIRDYIRGKAQILDPNNLVVTTTWKDYNSAYTVTSDTGQAEVSTITVTVNYPWVPEVFLIGPIDLTSTCTIPMSY